MGAGLPKFVTINLRQLESKYSEGEEVSLESLIQKRLLNPSGRDSKLPLKVPIFLVAATFLAFSQSLLFVSLFLDLRSTAKSTKSWLDIINPHTLLFSACSPVRE